MPDLTLLRHDWEPVVGAERLWTRFGEGYAVSGHPQIPSRALELLRWRCPTFPSTGAPGWRAGGAAPWVAVLDLHRAGEHDAAHVLAVLLRWCDQQTSAGAALWSIETSAPPPPG